ncbi:MAG: hypothetical protein PHE55_11320, partial [Methylococcaceae bacterium]|nr:hypothetical protein [Methylococcaceae bacterium]
HPTLSLSIPLLASCLLTSCNTYQDRQEAATVALPSSQATVVETEGVKFAALAYVDPQAGTVFGFDIRATGLLPVRISIDNRSRGGIKIIPRQTFLIDQENQAWPMLTSDQAFKRLNRATDFHANSPSAISPALDSLTGFALNLITAPGFSDNTQAKPERRLGQDLAEKILRNPKIQSGETASGALFFPGLNEAKSARSLRLSYEMEGQLQRLTLPLKTPSSTASIP